MDLAAENSDAPQLVTLKRADIKLVIAYDASLKRKHDESEVLNVLKHLTFKHQGQTSFFSEPIQAFSSDVEPPRYQGTLACTIRPKCVKSPARKTFFQA